MTDFSKTTTRQTVNSYRTLYCGKARQIVVTLRVMDDEDFFEFREKGTRARFHLPVADVFRKAVHRAALSQILERARKAKEQKAKKRRR